MTAPAPRRVEAVLFDLDGTLVDSVSDLAWAANRLREGQGLEPLPAAALRAAVASGTDAILERALSLVPGEHGHREARRRFLDLYAANLACRTALVSGVAEVLARLDSHRMPWGIVTNKHRRFTVPLLRTLGLDRRARCVVCGDGPGFSKPHPEPLRRGAALAGTSPAGCVYVGDARTDVEAAAAAGMPSVLALFGYLPPGADPSGWGATHLIERPGDLLPIIGLDP